MATGCLYHEGPGTFEENHLAKFKVSVMEQIKDAMQGMLKPTDMGQIRIKYLGPSRRV